MKIKIVAKKEEGFINAIGFEINGVEFLKSRIVFMAASQKKDIFMKLREICNFFVESGFVVENLEEFEKEFKIYDERN